MHTPPCILVVDDQPMNVDILCTRLAVQGYDVLTATDGTTAVELVTSRHPDLILLDIVLPIMDGLAVCRQVKSDPSLPFIPIIVLTVKTERQEILAGLEAGADDYLTKPVDQVTLMARVKAMLRLKARYDALHTQAAAVADQVAAATAWSQALAQQLYTQMAELEHLARLKHFVTPALAEVVVSPGSEQHLQRRQREIVVVWCEIRGVAALAARATPEQVAACLRDYHAVIGRHIVHWEGLLDQWTETHLRVVFNSLTPCEDAGARAVRMAVAIQQDLQPVQACWHTPQAPGGMAIGIAHGAATLGLFECAAQWRYTGVGPVNAVAAHLAATAQEGQILVSRPLWESVATLVEAIPLASPALPAEGLQGGMMQIVGVYSAS